MDQPSPAEPGTGSPEPLTPDLLQALEETLSLAREEGFEFDLRTLALARWLNGATP